MNMISLKSITMSVLCIYCFTIEKDRGGTSEEHSQTNFQTDCQHRCTTTGYKNYLQQYEYALLL